MNKKLNWIYYVSKRFSLVDRKGSSAVTTRLSALGICFGVMTLITVLSVMNGFQMQFIDSIIEISSYHVQATAVPDHDKEQFENFLTQNKNVRSYVAFKEAQSLITDSTGKEAGCLIRAVPQNVLSIDDGFAKEMTMIGGQFDLSDEEFIIIGSRLARSLGVRTGSKVNLFALSGSSDTALISKDRVFTVKGVFSCGYADINQSYAFINLDAAEKWFGSTPEIYGIKLVNQNMDKNFRRDVERKFQSIKISEWRDYNKSFFGALRVEKNMLMLLVILIFVVVAVNIYNSMRKLVYERRTEISTLASLGGSSRSIQKIFLLRGLMTGLKGAVPGCVLGLLLSFNIKTVFHIISKLQYFFTYISTSIFNPAAKKFIMENSMWNVYANIPARVMSGEVIFVTLFGIFSCVFASWIASTNVLKMKIAEVLHEE